MIESGRRPSPDRLEAAMFDSLLTRPVIRRGRRTLAVSIAVAAHAGALAGWILLDALSAEAVAPPAMPLTLAPPRAIPVVLEAGARSEPQAPRPRAATGPIQPRHAPVPAPAPVQDAPPGASSASPLPTDVIIGAPPADSD